MIKTSKSEYCYVVAIDIVGSTEIEKKLGSYKYSAEKNDFFKLLTGVAQYYESDVIRATGDGFRLFFKDVQSFLGYISAIDHINCVTKYEFSRFKVRIAGTSGVISTDCAGSSNGEDGIAINLSARLEKNAERPIVSHHVKTHYEELLGESASKYFKKMEGGFTLRGFPEDNDVYNFNTSAFSNDNISMTFHYIAHEYLKKTGVTFSSLGPERLLTPGRLIIPIVPRDVVNLIHAGLIQIARVFSSLDWTIEVLLADIALKNRCDGFREKIKKALELEKIFVGDVKRLSDFVKAGSDGACCIGAKECSKCVTSECSLKFCCEIIHGKLFKYLEESSISDVADVLDKKIENENKKEKKYLSSLRPLFTWSTVQVLYSDDELPSVVLAGADETKLWSSMPGSKHKSVHMQTISKGDSLQMSQNDLHWTNPSLCFDKMNEGNLFQWGSSIINGLSKFPYQSLVCNGQGVDISKEELADRIVCVLQAYNS